MGVKIHLSNKVQCYPQQYTLQPQMWLKEDLSTGSLELIWGAGCMAASNTGLYDLGFENLHHIAGAAQTPGQKKSRPTLGP